VVDFLQAVDASELPSAVAFLTGHPFPTSDPRVLGVRGLPRGVPAVGGPPLTLGDVSAAFAAVAEATGSGSRGARQARLAELAARASEEEREFLNRIVGGELRTGVSDGLVLEAIAGAAAADLTAVRRAALFLGDLAAVAALARAGGAAAWAAGPRPFVLLPMLAERQPTSEVLRAHGGRTALEFKYDGARVQVHRDGDRWASGRAVSDVTRSLPDVAAVARGLAGAPFILDGEVVALDAEGRPSLQELMRRFRRVHGVESLAARCRSPCTSSTACSPTAALAHRAPQAERWEALVA
jgi:DNA ligase-1